MIAYLEGTLAYKSPTQVYVDVGGIAYDVQISVNTFTKIETRSEAKLYTHLIVRDDAHILFGFYDREEKDLFVKLLSVSGIGPNTARVILSYMTPAEASSAIVTENVAAFKKVKGIGAKTAQRLILDLKDKISVEGIELTPTVKIPQHSIRHEAISALVALGFQKSAVTKQVDKVLNLQNDAIQVESLIKTVLQQLS